MKWLFRSFLLLMVLVFGLAITNPSLADYKDHIRYDLDGGNDGIMGQVASYFLSETASQLVERQNYIIFSVYVLPVPFSDSEITSIGIFESFIDIGL